MAFSNIEDWPFLFRDQEMEEALDFLAPKNRSTTSRILWIEGESGSGKSLFMRELATEFGTQDDNAVVLYLDIDESEFESISLSDRMLALLSSPSLATRTDPQQVPKEASTAGIRIKKRTMFGFFQGLLEATLVAIGEIPFVGKLIKALISPWLRNITSGKNLRDLNVWDRLSKISQSRNVLLIIDNYQFLPPQVAIELDANLAFMQMEIRIVLGSRTEQGSNVVSWQPRCYPDQRKTIRICGFTKEQTCELVTQIFPDSEDKDQVANVVHRSSSGNPKRIWLQLRSLSSGRESNQEGSYEDTILNLPGLDRFTLQVVTMLLGNLLVEDLVQIVTGILGSESGSSVEKSLADLTVMGLIIINSASANRVKTEHELVKKSVRRITTEEEANELRSDVVNALMNRLESIREGDEYSRLVDRLLGLISPLEIRSNHVALGHLIGLIDRENTAEHFHYLNFLFGLPACGENVDLLPPHCIRAILNSFQKNSQFEQGLAAVEIIRNRSRFSEDELALFSARYLVQRFHYSEAEELLVKIQDSPEGQMILFNINLNLCRNDQARETVRKTLEVTRPFNEFESVILRNSAHLYKPRAARQRLKSALRGFQTISSSFGEATAYNNLGIVELGDNQPNRAKKMWRRSAEILENLNSNEIYQPLTNLAVLAAVEGDFHQARHLLAQASNALSQRLQMDQLMIRVNQIVCSVVEGDCNLKNAEEEMKRLFAASRETQDKRFQAVVGWMARNLQAVNCKSPSTNFGSLRSESVGIGLGNVELEVAVMCQSRGYHFWMAYILSPNWRY